MQKKVKYIFIGDISTIVEKMPTILMSVKNVDVKRHLYRQCRCLNNPTKKEENKITVRSNFIRDQGQW